MTFEQRLAVSLAVALEAEYGGDFLGWDVVVEAYAVRKSPPPNRNGYVSGFSPVITRH